MAKHEIEVEVRDPMRWQPNGEYRKASDMEPYFSGGYIYRGPTGHDVLIAKKIEPVRESRWVPSLTPGLGYRSPEDAMKVCGEGTPLARYYFEDGKVVNVALEPAEGGGA